MMMIIQSVPVMHECPPNQLISTAAGTIKEKYHREE